ncbi:MAG TPA: amidohydrolase family protein [Stellaceae bacterium]|nr:amidohydrolase family protein [Stellaceae bacterium]
MRVVDAHVHIWATGQPSPGQRQVPALSAEDMLREMDEAGVDAAVIQPPAWDPTSNEVAVEAARRHPQRFAVLGWFHLDDPQARSLIPTWTSRPGMLGLRFTFAQPHQQSWPTDGTLDWLWPEAERAGIPIALAAATFLPVVGRIAERHPGLRLLVDHLGMPLRAKDDAAFANLPQLLALARHPNIAVKATAVPSYSSAPYPFRNIHGHLRRIYDAFGPERLFWGSDITRMPCSWRQCVTLFTEELAFLTPQDKEQIMGRALCRWIGWTRA